MRAFYKGNEYQLRFRYEDLYRTDGTAEALLAKVRAEYRQIFDTFTLDQILALCGVSCELYRKATHCQVIRISHEPHEQQGETVVASGTTVCHPKDRYTKKEGRKAALKKALDAAVDMPVSLKHILQDALDGRGKADGKIMVMGVMPNIGQPVYILCKTHHEAEIVERRNQILVEQALRHPDYSDTYQVSGL